MGPPHLQCQEPPLGVPAGWWRTRRKLGTPVPRHRLATLHLSMLSFPWEKGTTGPAGLDRDAPSTHVTCRVLASRADAGLRRAGQRSGVESALMHAAQCRCDAP